jgi:hypothetical protein
MVPKSLPRHVAIRYVQPLREGGSLPAVVDTDGGGMYVVKFRGAGQGAKALVAEVLVGAMAMAAGLSVPEIAIVDVTPEFGRTEPDPEIQELLRRSHGVNVGLRYLDGAFNFDANAAADLVDEDFASRLVWLDAYLTNPDRTHRNPNMLVWQRGPWLIDHGTALYAQHDWSSVDEQRTRTPFDRIAQHVLLRRATNLTAIDASMAKAAEEAIDTAVGLIPDDLLMDPVSAGDFPSADEARARYRRYLRERVQAPRAFVDEAVRAHDLAIKQPPVRVQARR